MCLLTERGTPLLGETMDISPARADNLGLGRSKLPPLKRGA